MLKAGEKQRGGVGKGGGDVGQIVCAGKRGVRNGQQRESKRRGT